MTMERGHNRMTTMLAGVVVALGSLVLADVAWAAESTTAKQGSGSRRGRYCSNTALILFEACKHQTADDLFVAAAKCVNVSDKDERDQCHEEAAAARTESAALCRAQKSERLAVCRQLGEGRYEPSFDPADFESDYQNLQNPNPYFPLTIGYRWDYAGGDETNTIEALNETKFIEGVTCITLKDKRYQNGQLVEETDDWYGQRKDGTVDFCGEQVLNSETFPGDNPTRPEILSTDGQWKAGRERDPSGHYFLGSPQKGDVHRQEFSPNNAEDLAEYLSLTYGFGDDPALDQHVPRDLVDRFCGGHDCIVTGESTALEPGTFHRKYYARGVGFFLEVDPRTGDTIQLVGCNFDAGCASLPQPAR